MTRILLLLPEQPTPAAAAHWWQIEAGELIDHGRDERWISLSEPPDAELVALAPVAAVRLTRSVPVGTTDRQAGAVAAASARDGSASEPGSVHAVATVIGDGEERRALTAVVATEAMQAWLDWARLFGREPAAITPSALLLPASDEWVEAEVGSDHLVGRGDVSFPFEPALAQALIGADRVRRLPPDELEPALVRAAEAPLLDLRQGRFARRRNWWPTREQLRELALLAACVPLLALIAAAVLLVRLNNDSERLDRQTAEVASAALDRPVTAETALAELDLQAVRSGGAVGDLSGPLAALYQHMQANSGVSATAIGWRSDGTLSTTLAATRTEDLNRLLLALQQGGYKVTAVPHGGTDGRQLADVTLRSGA